MAPQAHGTRKPALKARTARVMPRGPDDSLHVRVSEMRGRKTTEADYGVWRLPGSGPTAFRVFKPSENKAYDVDTDAFGPSCECLGHLNAGHKTVCRHVALCRALVAAGSFS